jgi:hypothetical protein
MNKHTEPETLGTAARLDRLEWYAKVAPHMLPIDEVLWLIALAREWGKSDGR